MERRLQNSLWALGAALTAALLLGSLRPAQDSTPRLADPGQDAGPIVTGAVADPGMPSPRRHKSLRRHGLSMPYFSFSSSIGG
ncbi:MAG TPA: hypothetical protein VFI26_01015 [Lysobacter sp.]|jgi:hypothetical protein|nr:hypothetical protein [Lysobacter sp.]